jgi:hypothetical protein
MARGVLFLVHHSRREATKLPLIEGEGACVGWYCCTPPGLDGHAEDLENKLHNRMLRIKRSANGEVIFTLSGRMDEQDIAELETLIRSEADGRSIVLDLKDLTLIGRDAISFLERWEAKGIALKNCADYVREWITRQRRGS